mmetsp:Transcript_60566/g.126794  ORF Transcript_60566/g.126794 Transcript_60566/m.126794 type:complete len:154 (-) Transcript_60566:569-1030(-)
MNPHSRSNVISNAPRHCKTREHHIWKPHSVRTDRLAVFIDKRLNTPTTLQDTLTLAFQIWIVDDQFLTREQEEKKIVPGFWSSDSSLAFNCPPCSTNTGIKNAVQDSLHPPNRPTHLLIADDYARVTSIRGDDFTIASATKHDPGYRRSSGKR